MREPEIPTGVRVCASILMLGGMWGVLLPIGMMAVIPRFRSAVIANATPASWALSAVACLPFLWCFWLGYHLWDGKPWTLRLAKWTFLLQTVQLAFPGFFYQFYTLGTMFDVTDEPSHWVFGFHFGSRIGPIIAPANADVILGVNVVAIFAASYLFKITAPGYREPKPGDNLGLI